MSYKFSWVVEQASSLLTGKRQIPRQSRLKFAIKASDRFQQTYRKYIVEAIA
ncbi:MAG: hypothetical protein WCP16_23895 [Pseudanabaena sp. ELA645]